MIKIAFLALGKYVYSQQYPQPQQYPANYQPQQNSYQSQQYPASQQPQQNSYQPQQNYQTPPIIMQSSYSESQPYAYDQCSPSINYSQPEQDQVHYLTNEYRQINGWGNNIANPQWGISWWTFQRIAPACWLPTTNTRLVSELVCQNNQHDISDTQSSMFNALGNLIIHDMALIKAHKPNIDFYLKIFNEEKFISDKIETSRTDFIIDNYGVKQQINAQTSYLDLSDVYGQDVSVTQQLRTGVDGLMWDTFDGLYYNPSLTIPMIGNPSSIFMCGDERCNENPGLLSMTALFIKMHNKIAGELKAYFPQLCDNRLFEEARRRVIAHYQHIIYDEYLPLLIGIEMGEYQGYDPTVDATVTNEWSTVSGRYNHVLQVQDIDLLTDELAQDVHAELKIDETAFITKKHINPGTVPDILRGLMWRSSKKPSSKYITGLQSNVAAKLDLCAMDMWRSEDHSTSVYNCIRQGYGLPPVYQFSDVTETVEQAEILSLAYGNNIEIAHTLAVANMEKPLIPGYHLGELHTLINWDQFYRLRAGDRFWYERQFCNYELNQIKTKTLSDWIRELFYMDSVPPYPLQNPPSPKQWFLGLQMDCNYNAEGYSGTDAIPIQAYWDGTQNKCICPLQFSYFKSKVNKCFCQYGYSYNPKTYLCEVAQNADYGDYMAYHKPNYNLADLTNTLYNNYMSPDYYNQQSYMEKAYNPINY